MVSWSNHFGPASRGGVYPGPQNALYVSAGMNVLKFPKANPKATDVSPWYGVYIKSTFKVDCDNFGRLQGIDTVDKVMY